MMGRSLLVVGVLGTAGVAVAGALGYRLSSAADPGMPNHVIAALAASLPVLFSHVWILLYLLATGRVIGSAVREGGLDPALLAESRRLRRVCYSWLLLAAGLVMALFLLGGAVAANTARPWTHHALFWAALAAQGIALWAEWRGLAANERLLGEVDGRLAAASAAAA
ncbi:MAG TPA: hypothetical protein VGH73_23860 [Thermoanaerobaculia bacterium]|jgi:hypothetical protein